MGIPCIAYNIPGLVDSISNGETGVLVQEGDINELAECMVKLYENKVALDTLGNKAKQRIIKYFSAKDLNAELENIYTSLIKANPDD
jgi:glycosyltransferase involved in cell wall biosynthesis